MKTTKIRKHLFFTSEGTKYSIRLINGQLRCYELGEWAGETTFQPAMSTKRLEQFNAGDSEYFKNWFESDSCLLCEYEDVAK
jgi:hypothetical protein